MNVFIVFNGLNPSTLQLAKDQKYNKPHRNIDTKLSF